MVVFRSLTARALAISALLLLSAVHDVLSWPGPRSAWARRGPGKKKLTDHFKWTIEGRQETEKPCADELATTITAPKANAWGELADVEIAAVVQWLFAQEDLNLTIREDATDWDNTM